MAGKGETQDTKEGAEDHYIKNPKIASGGQRLSRLRAASVKKVTLDRYLEHYKLLAEHAELNGLRLKDPEHLDLALESYLNHVYHQGEDLAVGNYVVAAVGFFNPTMRGKDHLPKTMQCLKGWRKLCPPRSRMPLPFEVVALLAVTAANEEKFEVGLVLLLTFFLYMRPSEFTKIRVQDIVCPVKKKAPGSYKNWSILLHPIEEGVPSKTEQWDEMLALDLPYQQFVGPALNSHLGLKKRSKTQKAFRVTPTEVNQFMVSHWETLGLQPVGAPHLYRLRHGGASTTCGHYRQCRLEAGGRASSQSRTTRRGADWPKSSGSWTTWCKEIASTQQKASQESFAGLEPFEVAGGGSLCGDLFWLWSLGQEGVWVLWLACPSMGHIIWNWLWPDNPQKPTTTAGMGPFRPYLWSSLGTPCNRFSRARDQPGGPPPLRSDLQPLGLQGLRPGDALKVKLGNALLRFSVKFLCVCLLMMIPCTLENPARSRLWICPPMVAFLRRRLVQSVQVGVLCFWHGLEEIYQIHWSSCRLHVFGANEMHRFQTWLLQDFLANHTCPSPVKRATVSGWPSLLNRIHGSFADC